MMPTKWMRQGDIDDGAKSGTSTSESGQLRESSRRNRLLEHENEVLRRRCASGPASLKARLIRYCTRCRISRAVADELQICRFRDDTLSRLRSRAGGKRWSIW